MFYQERARPVAAVHIGPRAAVPGDRADHAAEPTSPERADLHAATHPGGAAVGRAESAIRVLSVG
jgi:hypothetical protein